MLEEVSHSGLNGKKMRNQMKRADRILSTLRSFLLSCESPQGREAPAQAAASLGGTLMCFVFRQKGSLRCYALRTPRLRAHLRKRSKTAQLFRQTRVNIYTKAALPERRGSGQTRNQASRAPTELETWSRGPTSVKAAPGTNERSYQEVSSKHWTVKTHTRQSVKECHQRGTEELRLGSWF